MEEQVLLSSDALETKKLLSKNKFILLTLLTLNLYSVWWTYKAWRLFQEREQSDIQPAARTIFTIFYLYRLFEKIRRFAAANGYEGSYYSGLLYTGVVIFSFCAYLPEPFLLIAFLCFTCYTAPFEALNFAVANSGEYDTREQRGFNARQVVLLVIGGFFWFFLITGLLADL